jgi:hypothetical protein
MLVKVVLAEVAALRERERKGVADGDGERGRRWWARGSGTRFGEIAKIDVHRRRAREARLPAFPDMPTVGISVHLEDRREGDDLLRLARPAQEQHDVVGPDRAKIAVHGLRRMDEVRRLPEA